MEIYQLRVFLEVARHLSFTDAANALNLTQPAVSAKIKSLESELGTPLFYRVGRTVELTEAGSYLLLEGPALIQLENQLLQSIQAIKKGYIGTLKIGCTSAIAENWLPDILFRYRQQHPDIQTRCVVFESAEFLYRAITDNQIDVGISDVNFEEVSDIAATPICSIRYAGFVASDHAFAGKQWLSLKELRNEPWVILPSGFPSRLMFETRLEELGLSLEAFPKLEIVDTISLMRTYMSQGGYIGFASELEFKLDCQSGTLTSVPLQEFALPGNIYLLIPKRFDELYRRREPVSKHRSHHAHPVQSWRTFLQAATNPANDTAPIKFRSPSFALHIPTSRKPETLTLEIGVQNLTIQAVTAGLIIQRLGLLEHFLPRNGRYSATQYQIHWHDFATGAPIVEGLHSERLDIGVLGDYPLLLSAIHPDRASVPNTRLVSFVSSNPDGSCNAIVVPRQSDLVSIEDMQGRVIAVPFNSSAHSMVMRSLHYSQLLDKVQLTSLNHLNKSGAFNLPDPRADGYAHFAPFHDLACRKGKFRYLLENELKRLPAFYGVVVSGALAENHPEIVIAYLKALVAAQYWYDTTPSALTRLAQWTSLNTDVLAQILSCSYQKNQPGRFFLETKIRMDWLQQHINQLSAIPSNEKLQSINLNAWIQSEFLQRIH